MDVESNCVICGYSDRWGRAGVWTFMDEPWMSRVTVSSADTLTGG